jgi:hypothetical protein
LVHSFYEGYVERRSPYPLQLGRHIARASGTALRMAAQLLHNQAVLKRLWQGRRSRTAPAARFPIMCTTHPIDLVALEHFVTDHRPNADEGATEEIERGHCPACQERYIAASGFEKASWLIDGRLLCSCCGSTWSIEGDGWVARVGEGLKLVNLGAELPSGVEIDSSSFRVVALDDISALERVLRTELMSLPGVAVEVDSVLAVINDVVDGVVAAARGQAVEGAEVWRSVTEGGLDGPTALAIEELATNTLTEIHRLLDGSASSDQPEPQSAESRWLPPSDDPVT